MSKKLMSIWALCTMMFAPMIADAVSRAESTNKVKEQLTQLASMNASGAGFVTKQGKGRFAIISTQDIIGNEIICHIATSLGGQLKFPIETISLNEKFQIANVLKLMNDTDSTVAILLVADEILPMSLVAIEEHWALINVSKVADNATKDAAKEFRLHKEISRVTKALFSAVNPNKGAVAATTGRELELITSDPIDANSLVTIARGLPSYGLVAPRTVPYHRAIHEGWAPAPTNEAQRVIWERAKAEQSEKPSNPIRILPGQKPQGK